MTHLDGTRPPDYPSDWIVRGIAVRRRLKALAIAAVADGRLPGAPRGEAFRQGDAAMQDGDLDQAVAYYRTAAQAAPDNPNYKIALERAMLAASRAAFRTRERVRGAGPDRSGARRISDRRRIRPDQPSGGGQGGRARPDDPRPDRSGAAAPGDRRVARPGARGERTEPLLNPASREPLNMRFTNSNIRDILNSIGSAAGIDIQFDPQVPTDRGRP